MASASAVSAGIVNPVVLKKFTTFWLAMEQIELLRSTVNEIQEYTCENVLIDEPVHRIFHDSTERDLWVKKSQTENLSAFLDDHIAALPVVKNPFQTGKVMHSARIDVKLFFEALTAYFLKNNCIVDEDFCYDQLSNNRYNDICFANIVFCEGMNVRNNPYFADLPVYGNKGHHLHVKLSVPLENSRTVKKKHFLFPVDSENYYYGGTYSPVELSDEIDASAVQQLKDGLTEFYPHPYEIKEVRYGFRPTVKDRRPIIGCHSDHPNYYVFNGLGARGILNGCYFARELFLHIDQGKELLPEVDLSRFNLGNR